jgi:RNA polymerase sigma factor (TIGR02999 family)
MKNMEQSAEKSREITRMLQEWSGGKPEALNALLPLVYAELRRQVAHYLRRDGAGHTLQTTDLIHKAYLKLIDQRRVNWQNRANFFASPCKRCGGFLLITRGRHGAKRDGRGEDLMLEEAALIVTAERSIDLVALDEALTRLAEFDERQARIVELKYFSGLSIEKTAAVLRLSPASIKNDWQAAKVWLYREITG